MSEELPAVLVIGGHDSSGGAGVDADREALECAGVDASIVVTAWTVQDSQGLRDLGAVDPEVWGREALAESKNLAGSFRTVKFGLLPSAAAVSTAAKLAAAWAGRVNIVIDPVIAPSRGGRFLDFSALEAYREKLLPLGGIWTPNLPELAELVACDPSELALEPGLRVTAANKLIEAGAEAVLVKGGHGHENPVLDLLVVASGEASWIERRRIAGRGIRGSGCRYASFLGGRLAAGEALEPAARAAGEWVADCIRKKSQTTE